MSEYNSSALEDFLKTIESGQEEAVSAFSRTFGDGITSISVSKSGNLFLSAVDALFRAPGLLMLPITGGVGCGILLPKSTGLVPGWCDNPDPTGKSKLTTLAQEWGMTLLPEEFFPDDFLAGTVPDLIDAVERGNIGSDAAFVELELKKGDVSCGKAMMIWPLNEPANAMKPPADSMLNIPPPPIPGLSAGIGEDGLIPFDEESMFDLDAIKNITVDDLPGFSRSLLKVRIPVAAVLAQARRPIKMILELGVGSVIQFDKSCDALLDLQISGVTVGTGEAVKIGDKFGLRVHNVLLPEERFRKVEVRREGEYKKRKKGPTIIGKAPIRSLEPTKK